MSDELPLCPFCGGEVVAVESPEEACWYIDCTECTCRFGGYSSRLDMIPAWSRRSPKPFQDFYNKVCDHAEKNMAHTGTVSGAHWNAMRQVLKEMGIEVTR